MQLNKLARHMVLTLVTASATYMGSLHAQESAGAVDGIAAVVNTKVITLREVQSEMTKVSKNLRAQNIPVPDQESLQKQVLNRLVDEYLLSEEAGKMGLHPENVDVDETAKMIAERNNLTLEALRQEVLKSGTSWSDYLEGLREEVVMSQIRQRVIDPRISVSESEIDAFLKRQGLFDEAGTDVMPQANEMIELAQILIRVPENASRATQAELKQKAEAILQQVRQGADFSGLAAASSDGSEALQGGSMGVRPLESWPDVFISAIQNTPSGQVAEIIRSGAGFHILKVVQRGQAQANPTASASEMVVMQTKASHILIKFNQITTDEKAKQRIDQVAARLRDGESFEELARAYSEDATAPQGGSLSWLSPGETVPAFEQAMDALALGQISAPVRTQFGWHIIRVDERRERNVGNEYRRMQARQMLREQRVEPAFDDWFSQIKGQAFIDNRLDPASSSRRRN